TRGDGQHRGRARLQGRRSRPDEGLGLAAPSTSIESERIGPVADQVKEAAKETGQEALDRSREVAQATAHSAVETAKDEGRAHGHELASGLREEPDQLA
ncbi:MAG TPA: hypothetical protein VIU16_01305, partial [Gaiellaceae bacterium]